MRGAVFPKGGIAAPSLLCPFREATPGKENAVKKEALKNCLYNKHRGRSKAICGDSLRRELHMTEKEMRKCVNRLRREGVPICSDQTGYFYAQSADEVLTTIQFLLKMRQGLDSAITGMNGTLRDFVLERG